MRLKKPTRVLIDQVRITREGSDAIIDHADAGISGTRITVGPDIATMTDREIIDVFNGILAAQERLLAAWDKTVIEEPRGEKQIDYHENGDQWVPRGDVLRCIIDDAGPDGEVTIADDCETRLYVASAQDPATSRRNRASTVERLLQCGVSQFPLDRTGSRWFE